MSPIEALSWILRKAQGATDIETGKVIDDETYRYDEPIVLDLKAVINAARVR
jgi:hypothetical protein